MNILSIQSHVAYGHVGNAAAAFAMQRLGHEVWPVNTVQFSNHPGYGAWRGDVFSPAHISACIEGIGERGVFGQCDAVLSGYLGSAAIGDCVLQAVARVRAARPDALYCCDPVMGDDGKGLYVAPDIAAHFRDRAAPLANILTPNHFELEWLTGQTLSTREDFAKALGALHERGPSVVLVTSAHCEGAGVDDVDLVASDSQCLWRLRTPRLAHGANGAGDAITALFLVHYLTTRSARVALERAASSVWGLLNATAAANARELLLITAQAELVAPSRVFAAESW